MIGNLPLKLLGLRIRLAEFGLATPISWDFTRNRMRASGKLQLFGAWFWAFVLASYTLLELTLLIPKLQNSSDSSNILFLLIDILHSGLNQIASIMSFLILWKRDEFINWFNKMVDLDDLLRGEAIMLFLPKNITHHIFYRIPRHQNSTLQSSPQRLPTTCRNCSSLPKLCHALRLITRIQLYAL